MGDTTLSEGAEKIVNKIVRVFINNLTRFSAGVQYPPQLLRI